MTKWLPVLDASYGKEITNRGSRLNESLFLFNLRTDPYETFNLVDIMPNVANDLLKALAKYKGGAVKAHNPPLTTK